MAKQSDERLHACMIQCMHNRMHAHSHAHSLKRSNACRFARTRLSILFVWRQNFCSNFDFGLSRFFKFCALPLPTLSVGRETMATHRVAIDSKFVADYTFGHRSQKGQSPMLSPPGHPFIASCHVMSGNPPSPPP
jgi:hypothetical protein